MRGTSLCAGVVLALTLAGAPGAIAADQLACTPSGKNPHKLGVMLMHGKATFGSGHMRGGSGPTDYLAKLKTAVAAAGFRVAAPEMPWTQTRVYSASYEQAMEEIADAMAGLKRRGAQRFVVGGHSLGANAALGYAALKGGVVGVIALAPGQTPEQPSFQRKLGASVAKAKAMVAAGKGNEQAVFDDINSGDRAGTVRTSAANYLSYFDPDGNASMPKNVARFKSGIALFWAVAEADPLSQLGEGYAFDKAPPNPLSRYLVLPGDHLEAPANAAALVVAWLKCL